MLGYLDYIRVSDGQHSVTINDASEITIKHATGRITKVLVGNIELHSKPNANIFLLGHETKQGNRLIERLHYGKEFKTPAVMIPYSAKTWQSRHGTIKRRTQQGTIHTTFKRGRFMQQALYDKQGACAWEFKRGDTEIKTARLHITNIEFDYINSNYLLQDGHSILGNKDYAQFGKNFSFIEYAGKRNKRIKNKGSFALGQKTGAWVINYKEQAYYKGLMVDKDFLTIDPATIPISRVMKEQNAQVRAMYIAKIGMERLCRELKAKVIHEEKDKAGLPMRLLELPLKCDDGNGDEQGSKQRVLQVKCTSTQNDYFLSVPDFVWANGDKEPIDTCTKAKQWGFQDDTSKLEEEICFIKET